ncbi:SAM-dependent chlorinase/fluorinase [bacterium]|nr:SAM-dependent chlorinase/fluorinase [bacterium]
MSHPIITLLTDFGLKDGYSAAMKAVILGICPHANIVDISHSITPQSISEAAFVLDSCFDYFPAETIHVAVVDPGVGTERAILAARIAGQTVLAPDNGLLSLLIIRYPDSLIYRVDNDALYAKVISNTFHGRDIFAPIAGKLACGFSVDAVGPITNAHRSMSMMASSVEPEGVVGHVIYIDHFGNAITNIYENQLPAMPFYIELPGVAQISYSSAYASCAVGDIVALTGSHGRLEIAVNGGSAAELLGLTSGTPVYVHIN